MILVKDNPFLLSCFHLFVGLINMLGNTLYIDFIQRELG